MIELAVDVDAMCLWIGYNVSRDHELIQILDVVIRQGSTLSVQCKCKSKCSAGAHWCRGGSVHHCSLWKQEEAEGCGENIHSRWMIKGR
jgi:hypothetical protein